MARRFAAYGLPNMRRSHAQMVLCSLFLSEKGFRLVIMVVR